MPPLVVCDGRWRRQILRRRMPIAYIERVERPGCDRERIGIGCILRGGSRSANDHGTRSANIFPGNQKICRRSIRGAHAFCGRIRCTAGDGPEAGDGPVRHAEGRTAESDRNFICYLPNIYPERARLVPLRAALAIASGLTEIPPPKKAAMPGRKRRNERANGKENQQLDTQHIDRSVGVGRNSRERVCCKYAVSVDNDRQNNINEE